MDCNVSFRYFNDAGADESGKKGTLAVLVVGGAGYIGSHAARVLQRKGYSVHDVVSAAERVTGDKVPTQITPRRPGDPPELVADPKLAEKLLKWKARRGLDEIGTAWSGHSGRQAFRLYKGSSRRLKFSAMIIPRPTARASATTSDISPTTKSNPSANDGR
jgi:UDP-glucose 4-epimerase